MSRPIVRVVNLGKRFRRYHVDRPGTIQEAVARGLTRLRSVDRFWGLREVSFDLPPGRSVGIVGSNGSGKSTLLRLIGGVGRPDTGRIEVNGRIGALLDLGAGFHPDLTGRENAVLAGILNGLTRRQVLERMDSIVAFAEVEKAIDSPVRAFSSGMRTRLSFAVAVHTDPEILLIDEVLSVGDVGFQRKGLDRIEEFKAAGCSILLVTHDRATVEEFCDEAIWLDRGRVMAQGPAKDVVRQYGRHMGEEIEEDEADDADEKAEAIATEASSDDAIRDLADTPRAVTVEVVTPKGSEVVVDDERYGSVELAIQDVRVLDDAGVSTSEFASGRPLQIEITYVAVQRIVAPIFCARILRAGGLLCCDMNTEVSGLSFSSVHGPGRLTVHVDRLDLNTGTYVIDVACYAQDWAYKYDFRRSACSFVVRGKGITDAPLDPPHRWEFVTPAPVSPDVSVSR